MYINTSLFALAAWCSSGIVSACGEKLGLMVVELRQVTYMYKAVLIIAILGSMLVIQKWQKTQHFVHKMIITLDLCNILSENC
jgi:hypothetical protein